MVKLLFLFISENHVIHSYLHNKCFYKIICEIHLTNLFFLILPNVHQLNLLYISGVEYQNKQKKELQQLILKRKHEQYIKDGTTNIKQVDIKENNKYKTGRYQR